MTRTMKIAFQGEPGANSHIAIVKSVPLGVDTPNELAKAREMLGG